MQLKDVKEAAALAKALRKIPDLRKDLAAQLEGWKSKTDAVALSLSDISMMVSSSEEISCFIPLPLANEMLDAAETSIRQRLWDLGVSED